LGVADIGSWGVFSDMGGDDLYDPGSGLARASSDSLAVFFDHAGNDQYSTASGRGNQQQTPDQTGGLFIDH
jgi:hypothetical protein